MDSGSSISIGSSEEARFLQAGVAGRRMGSGEGRERLRRGRDHRVARGKWAHSPERPVAPGGKLPLRTDPPPTGRGGEAGRWAEPNIAMQAVPRSTTVAARAAGSGRRLANAGRRERPPDRLDGLLPDSSVIEPPELFEGRASGGAGRARARRAPISRSGGQGRNGETGHHRRDLRHPASRASGSVQNQRSPFDGSIRVRS